ncbi:S-layer homology domain-containing protein [Bacillus solimangrovi]|uniref:SLH domain-containing protein n=1 Tax=Bacillus solimangrovi TaxID=1305675 RepID=A0A1E5LJ60_9BACI|nr:S-layer homology domain-containing protein [Bacillus solimangrovi]OEH94101.1 hypothetical protein BFG57_09650 [Bacillus solimangrovi]
MKYIKSLSLLFTVMFILLFTFHISPTHAAFSDVEGHWAESDIKQLVNEGLLFGGYEDGSFNPNGQITRAEFVTVLSRILELEGANNPFQDKESAKWANDMIGGAVKTGVIDTSDFGNKFEPNKPITRQEMSKMIALALGKENEQFSFSLDVLNERVLLPFTDYNEIDKKDIPYIALANGTGIISGYPDDSFGLEKQAIRAEATVMFHRFMHVMNTEINDHYALKQYVEIAQNGHNLNNFAEGRTFKSLDDIQTTFDTGAFTTTIKSMIVYDLDNPNDPYRKMFNEYETEDIHGDMREKLKKKDRLPVAIQFDVKQAVKYKDWETDVGVRFGNFIGNPTDELARKFGYKTLTRDFIDKSDPEDRGLLHVEQIDNIYLIFGFYPKQSNNVSNDRIFYLSKEANSDGSVDYLQYSWLKENMSY